MNIVLSRAFRIIQSFVSRVGEARRPVQTPAESEETPGTRKNMQSAVTEPINHKMRLFPSSTALGCVSIGLSTVSEAKDSGRASKNT
jgi:hypothetical protein